MAKYKDWFAGKRFVTIDKESAYHPDIIGDVHELPLKDEEVAAEGTDAAKPTTEKKDKK